MWGRSTLAALPGGTVLLHQARGCQGVGYEAAKEWGMRLPRNGVWGCPGWGRHQVQVAVCGYGSLCVAVCDCALLYIAVGGCMRHRPLRWHATPFQNNHASTRLTLTDNQHHIHSVTFKP